MKNSKSINFSGLFRERDELKKKLTKAVARLDEQEQDKSELDDRLRDELRQLDQKESDIRMEYENDPEVIANSCDGNHPAVVRFSDELEANADQVEAIYKQIHSRSQAECKTIAQMAILKLDQENNAEAIECAWEICN